MLGFNLTDVGSGDPLESLGGCDAFTTCGTWDPRGRRIEV
jgi:hypothetical protein